jgi:nucleoside-diphosphate-sugar epimerase
MNIGTVLVTGANGFLGKTILSQLLRENLTVCGTDMGSTSAAIGIAYQKADITRPEELIDVIGSVAIVIHAAGLAHIFDKSNAINAPFKAINEQGTANVARAAAEVGMRHFILISSVSVYGSFTQGVYDENAPCCPEGPYAESKYQAEQRAIEIAKASGMALTILRLATLYGEGDPGNVARLMRTVDRGHFIWIGNGSNRKSLLHREDAARACLLAVQRPAAGVNVYNVSGSPCTMREVVEGLAEALGKRVPPFGIPASLVRQISGLFSILPVSRLQNLGATAQKWLADDVVDGSKFAQAFNSQPRVSLTDGLRREVAWYRAEQAKHGT